MQPIFQLTDSQRALCIQTASAAHPPGTILHDFDAVLAHIGADGIAVSPKGGQFAVGKLPQLNALMAEPDNIDLPKARQMSYPKVDGIHLLLRATGIAKVETAKSGKRMRPDPAMLGQWQALNPTERYFSLLAAWWTFADDAQRGEDDYLVWTAANLRRAFVTKFAGRGSGSRKLTPSELTVALRSPGSTQIALMGQFGLLDITQAKTVPGKPWALRSAAARPWGVFASGSFHDLFPQATLQNWIAQFLDNDGDDGGDGDWDDDADSEGGDDGEDDGEDGGEGGHGWDEDGPTESQTVFSEWAAQIMPLFPDWRHFLARPKPPPPLIATLTLKVSHAPEVWRRIALPSTCTFEALAATILKAFRFDDEDYHRFTYQNEYGKTLYVDDPRSLEPRGKHSDLVLLGKAGLEPGQTFVFDHDSGRCHRFEVLVESVDGAKLIKKATVLEKQGKAPKQYDLRW